MAFLVVAALALVVAFGAGVVIWQTNSDSKETIHDDFVRPDSPSALGRPWKQLSGTWGIADDEAYVSQPAPDIQLAVVVVGSGDADVVASMAAPAVGAGIAFRVVDKRNFWAVVAAPAYGTWNVVRVVRGLSTFVENTGLTLAPTGPASIRVRLAGDGIAVFADGRQVAFTKSSLLRGGKTAGLALIGDVADARWTGFSATVGT